ncbi:hypothetical protein DYB30_001145 [Aphanomyces astaci]|uniref:Protein kinase domain-containing protein n=1 Tax=Aphanomyces astaci TaxID=112090 RepID=A0A397E112_APHAT|nr:hypothetical protein DYB38_000719 [Aphanomyces astaci]RHY71739.1 hypothetical protein DYB30_001145 [Aphanomyces astaci]RHY73364.1 hypothetical protein DYB34_000493 [Aphanomyces astaci]
MTEAEGRATETLAIDIAVNDLVTIGPLIVVEMIETNDPAIATGVAVAAIGLVTVQVTETHPVTVVDEVMPNATIVDVIDVTTVVAGAVAMTAAGIVTSEPVASGSSYDAYPPPEPAGPWDPKAEAEKDESWARIYVSNLPNDVTTDELQSIFGGIGVIAKEKQKRGYKDQWESRNPLRAGGSVAPGDAEVEEAVAVAAGGALGAEAAVAETAATSSRIQTRSSQSRRGSREGGRPTCIEAIEATTVAIAVEVDIAMPPEDEKCLATDLRRPHVTIVDFETTEITLDPPTPATMAATAAITTLETTHLIAMMTTLDVEVAAAATDAATAAIANGPCPVRRIVVDKTKDLSDDSASHDDTIGSYEGVPGDVIDKRYEILRDAGLGTFGRVVLCKDLLSKNKDDIVALKVVRKVEKYSESAKIEANILKHVNDKDVRGDSLCVRMHRWFEFQGHVILVFEQLGGSLYDYLKQQDYKPFPLDSIRAYAWQLLTSLVSHSDHLKFLHHIKLIHTDLKPENILLVRDAACGGDRAKACQRKGYLVPPLHDQVKLIDFGGATYDDESKSGIINTRQYRSPEVMLGVGWSFPSDIWSAACIIAELYIGELLFVTHENLEHLALIEKCIGSFPADMVARADRQAQKYFTDHGALCWPQGAATRESVDHVRKMKSLEEIIDGGGDDDDGAHELLDLLTRMLAMDPTERVTAADALQHPFFKGVSLQTLHG